MQKVSHAFKKRRISQALRACVFSTRLRFLKILKDNCKRAEGGFLVSHHFIYTFSLILR